MNINQKQKYAHKARCSKSMEKAIGFSLIVAFPDSAIIATMSPVHRWIYGRKMESDAIGYPPDRTSTDIESFVQSTEGLLYRQDITVAFFVNREG